jgi:hypothetical protein
MKMDYKDTVKIMLNHALETYIAAYDQEFADKILGIDGVEEFTIYMAPVGKVQ